jgi:TatA/E family protein of Tat protein translocase
MPFNLGIGEVLVVMVLALLIFGKRLPEVGRSLGRGIVEFKEGLKGAAASLGSSDKADPDLESTPPPAESPPAESSPAESSPAESSPAESTPAEAAVEEEKPSP